MHVSCEKRFHARHAPTAADFAVMIHGLEIDDYDDSEGMPSHALAWPRVTSRDLACPPVTSHDLT